MLNKQKNANVVQNSHKNNTMMLSVLQLQYLHKKSWWHRKMEKCQQMIWNTQGTLVTIKENCQQQKCPDAAFSLSLIPQVSPNSHGLSSFENSFYPIVGGDT